MSTMVGCGFGPSLAITELDARKSLMLASCSRHTVAEAVGPGPGAARCLCWQWGPLVSSRAAVGVLAEGLSQVWHLSKMFPPCHVLMRCIFIL